MWRDEGRAPRAMLWMCTRISDPTQCGKRARGELSSQGCYSILYSDESWGRFILPKRGGAEWGKLYENKKK